MFVREENKELYRARTSEEAARMPFRFLLAYISRKN